MTEATLILGKDNPPGGRHDFVQAARAAFNKGIYFEFAGGLGDLVNQLVLTDALTKLENLRSTDRAVIVLLCQNPDAPDLFLYHRLAGQFTILSLGACVGDSYRRRHGLPPAPPVPPHVESPPPFRPRFSKSDEAALAMLPEKFVAFSVTAAGGRLENRSIPSRIYTAAARCCLDLGLAPVFLGKRYAHGILDEQRPFFPHDESDPPNFAGVVSLIDHMSVSGSLECVRRAAATVVCNSAIMNASWRMRRPTFYVATDHDWAAYERREKNGYTYGLAYPENTGCSHAGYTDEKLSAFLGRAQTT